MSKLNRNRPSCLVYKNSNRRLKNKRAKLERHLKQHPTDVQSSEALREL